MMAYGSGERYSLDAFKTLFELHPELREIIVEGRVDAAIVSWFATQSGLNCDVFGVDDRVDVPSDVVRASGQSVGNRGEVIALARALNSEAGRLRRQLICIADADFDHLTGTRYDDELLLLTDVATLELYVVAPSSLERFHSLFLRNHPPIDLYTTVKMFLPALVDVFLVRHIIGRFDSPPPMISRIESCIFKRGSTLVADVPELIRRCVTELRLSREEVESLASDVEDLNKKVVGDVRKYVNWHDFARLLIRVLELRNDLAKTDVIERALTTCLDYGDVKDQPLFVEILRRFGEAAEEQ